MTGADRDLNAGDFLLFVVGLAFAIWFLFTSGSVVCASIASQPGGM